MKFRETQGPEYRDLLRLVLDPTKLSILATIKYIFLGIHYVLFKYYVIEDVWVGEQKSLKTITVYYSLLQCTTVFLPRPEYQGKVMDSLGFPLIWSPSDWSGTFRLFHQNPAETIVMGMGVDKNNMVMRISCGAQNTKETQ